MGFNLARLTPKPHWSPRYIADRAALWLWTRSNPDAPWLVPSAVAFLDQWLRPTDTLVEFGSGRSTLWFARRVQRVISVEHNPTWFSTVKTRLAVAGVSNVDYHLDSAAAAGAAPTRPDSYLEPATRALEASATRADVILVDGIHRDHCAHWALPRLRTPGGLLVIDNCNRFFPAATRAPASLGPSDRAPTPIWQSVIESVRPLRQARLSDGVTDTLLLFT